MLISPKKGEFSPFFGGRHTPASVSLEQPGPELSHVHDEHDAQQAVVQHQRHVGQQYERHQHDPAHFPVFPILFAKTDAPDKKCIILKW